MMKTELLAPAGDIQAAYAALYYGADALYLGLKSFSARANATNFDEHQLNEISAYAHSLNRKVYVTINTLLQEDELPDLIKNLDLCSRYKVDGVILQDLGVAHLIKTQYPELEMHASTQMAVHNKEGALFLKNLGFSRVVLARELNLDEINEISSIDGLETEVFIHGALCYSYSGVCEFSSLEYGKSANRGKCLYPCRGLFDENGNQKHLFSMKDLALEGDVLKLKATSLKIEGRKKSALYVAAVTDYYRKILDGKKPDQKNAENIKQIFSRPWCQFHLEGKKKDVVDPDFVGHRGLKIGQIERISKGKLVFTPTRNIARFDGLQIDVDGQEKPFGFSVQNIRQNLKNVIEAKAGFPCEIDLPKGYPFLKTGFDVYLASSSYVKGAYDYSKPKPGAFQNKIGIDVQINISSNKLSAQSGNDIVEFEGAFDKAKDSNQIYDAFLKAFQKTGDTPFHLEKFDLHNPNGLFVPVSLINELRRQLYEKIKPDFKHGHLLALPEKKSFPDSKWIIKTDNLHLLSKLDLSLFHEIIYLIDDKPDLCLLKKLPFEKVRIALPVICRQPSLFLSIIDELLKAGFYKWEISNYWGFKIIDPQKYDVSFGPFLYMFNSQAVMMAEHIGAKRITLGVDDTLNNLQKLSLISPLDTSFIVYQDTPLFTSAVCVRKNDCAHCKGGVEWLTLNHNKHRYQALLMTCQTMLFDEFPLCLSKMAKEIHASYYQMDFCYKPYTPQKVKELAEKLMFFEEIVPSIKGNILRSDI